MARPEPHAIDDLLRACARLDRHIHSLDAGEAHADDDVAAILRILLCSGEGNQLIERYLSQARRSPVAVRVGASPSFLKGVVFSIGAIPSTDSEPGSLRPVKFPQEFLRKQCLYVAGMDAPLDWREFLTNAGNSFGAHYAKRVPEYFETITLFGASGHPVTRFLLRSCGVIASSVVHALAHTERPDHQAVKHSESINGLTITHATFRANGDEEEIGGQIKAEDWTKPNEIMRARRPNGQIAIFSLLAGGKLHLEIQNP